MLNFLRFLLWPNIIYSEEYSLCILEECVLSSCWRKCLYMSVRSSWLTVFFKSFISLFILSVFPFIIKSRGVEVSNYYCWTVYFSHSILSVFTGYILEVLFLSVYMFIIFIYTSQIGLFIIIMSFLSHNNFCLCLILI